MRVASSGTRTVASRTVQADRILRCLAAPLEVGPTTDYERGGVEVGDGRQERRLALQAAGQTDTHDPRGTASQAVPARKVREQGAHHLDAPLLRTRRNLISGRPEEGRVLWGSDRHAPFGVLLDDQPALPFGASPSMTRNSSTLPKCLSTARWAAPGACLGRKKTSASTSFPHPHQQIPVGRGTDAPGGRATGPVLTSRGLSRLRFGSGARSSAGGGSTTSTGRSTDDSPLVGEMSRASAI